MAKDAQIIRLIQEHMEPIDASNLETSIDHIARALAQKNVVLIGEATHGTHEFYKYRALITRKLIENHHFNVIAIEADWPDTYQANCYVKGFKEFGNPLEALSELKRFPSWMWRNYEVLEFLSWLKEFNDSRVETEQKVGFYGLDLYSLHASIEAVIRYLWETDYEAAKRAIIRYSCFDHEDKDAQQYGFSATYGLRKDCKDEAIRELVELEKEKYQNYEKDETFQKEAFFSALQNARSVKSAEAYYRSMFESPAASWNLRDKHMFEAFMALVDYSNSALLKPAKVVIWAHNSHIGNATATEMAERGELNIGQLVKQKYGEQAFLLGFTTYTGTVVAADEWGGPAKIKQITPALNNSWENLFHNIPTEQFSLFFNEKVKNIFESIPPKLQRAIGVIYKPETERYSHYFYSLLSSQFDGVIHIDTTSALRPIDTLSQKVEEAPETYPTSL